MSVSGHLRIAVDEYDARIRAFVPYYEELILCAAQAMDLLATRSPTVTDLGIGTGALAAACLAQRPQARIIGLDLDESMLDIARSRLGASPGVELRVSDFVKQPLPPCNALMACLSLHHIQTAAEKQAFYTSCRQALEPSGILVSADCFPAADERLAARHREAWLAHMETTCTRAEAEGHLESWAAEDFYFPLEHELDWLRSAGFQTEVLWRKDGFAVVAALCPGSIDGARAG